LKYSGLCIIWDDSTKKPINKATKQQANYPVSVSALTPITSRQTPAERSEAHFVLDTNPPFISFSKNKGNNTDAKIQSDIK